MKRDEGKRGRGRKLKKNKWGKPERNIGVSGSRNSGVNKVGALFDGKRLLDWEKETPQKVTGESKVTILEDEIAFFRPTILVATVFGMSACTCRKEIESVRFLIRS